MIQKGVPLDELLQFVTDNWRRLKDERKYKEDLWIECFLAYTSKFGKTWSNLSNGRSKRFLPLADQVVNTLAATRTNSIMPNDQWMALLPRTPGDDQKAKAFESLIKWQQFKVGFRGKVSQANRGLSVYGNQPYCVRWRRDVAQIPDYETYMGQLSSMAVTGEEANPLATKPLLKYEGPDLELGNIFDYVQDRDADSEEDALRIQRFYKSLHYIQDMAEPDPETGFSVFENVEDLTDTSRTLESSDGLQNMANAKLGFQPTVKGGIELLEAWGDFPVTMGGKTHILKNYVVVVANRNRVIRCEPNPYLHGRAAWRLARLYTDPGEVYGRGDIEAVLGLQDGANKRFNQVIDANEIAIDPMWVARENGVINLDDLRFMPGGIIEVAQQGDLEPLSKVSMGSLGMEELGFVMAQLNQTTGAMQGFTTEAYQKSATEVAATAQMGNARGMETIKHLEHTFIGPVLEDWVSLDQQLMDREIMVRVISDGAGMANDPVTGIPYPLGPQVLAVAPDDIAGEFDIIPVGGEWQQKTTQEVAQSMQFFGMIMQSNLGQFIKAPEFISTMATLQGLSNAWRWIKSPQEVMLEQQQQMALQAMQQQMGGPAGPGGPGAMAGGPQAPSQQPGPVGISSMAGAPEGAAPPTAGPDPAQLSGPTLGP